MILCPDPPTGEELEDERFVIFTIVDIWAFTRKLLICMDSFMRDLYLHQKDWALWERNLQKECSEFVLECCVRGRMCCPLAWASKSEHRGWKYIAHVARKFTCQRKSVMTSMAHISDALSPTFFSWFIQI